MQPLRKRLLRALSLHFQKPQPVTPPPEVAGPDVILLVAEAGGPAARQMHRFGDTRSAAQFIQVWFPDKRRSDISAFWALTWRPDPELHPAAEPIVIIRDSARPSVVYPFSFVGLQTAQYFLRQQLGLGLDLSSVALYWAVPIIIATGNPGRVHLFPVLPPERSRRLEDGFEEADEERAAHGGWYSTGWVRPHQSYRQLTPSLSENNEATDDAGRQSLSYSVDDVIREAERAIREGDEPRLGDIIRAPAPERASTGDAGTLSAADVIAEAERIVGQLPPIDKRLFQPPDPSRKKKSPRRRKGPDENMHEEPEERLTQISRLDVEAIRAEAAAQIAEAATVVEEAIEAVEKNRRQGKAQRRRIDPLSREGVSPDRREKDYLDYLLRLKKELYRFRKMTRWEKREGPFQGFGSPPGRF